MRQTAVVTGAAIRVGRAVAIELARSGFDLALHYRSSAEQVDEVADLCREAGARVFTVAADLAHPEQVEALAGQVRERFSRLDLLVNNASIFSPRPFAEITLAEWEAMQAINLRAPFLLSQALLPQLRAAEGLVVHLCDIGAENPVSGYAHYSVSKAGLVMLVKAMAVELAPTVRTIGVSPGHVAWPEDYDEATRARLTRRIPMGRVGTPEDIARLVRFAALEGDYLNGVIIPVDGGLSVRY